MGARQLPDQLARHRSRRPASPWRSRRGPCATRAAEEPGGHGPSHERRLPCGGLNSEPQTVSCDGCERALDRVRDRDWFPAAQAAEEVWGRLAAISPEELREANNPGWPRYFAEPESAASRSRIERLGREVRWNLEVLRFWEPLESTTDLRPILARIACPTLVVVGEHDFVCGPVWNRPIAAGIRGATYVEIPGVGHIPHYEAPEAFRRVLFDWLESSA